MTATVRLLDYGVGNMHSLQKALERAGLDVEMAPAADGPGEADGLVLPGVGAFAPAAEAIAPVREELAQAIRDGLPTLGVCLGMQLLCEGSVEGDGIGLGLIEGEVERLAAPRIPHIGWNTVEGPSQGPLAAIDGRHVYYVHSFVVPDNPTTVATTTYGQPFPAILHDGNLLATQFHPEKSSGAGRIVLDAFTQLVEASS